MIHKKRIYVCCGTGVATSTVIAKKVGQALKENQIHFEMSQYKVSEISSVVKNRKPDLIVSSAEISGDVGDVPVVYGRSFLTGRNKQQTIDEILAVLKG